MAPLFYATPITIMPFFTSAVAIPAPIPELAPVTRATRPDQRSVLKMKLMNTPPTGVDYRFRS